MTLWGTFLLTVNPPILSLSKDNLSDYTACMGHYAFGSSIL